MSQSNDEIFISLKDAFVKAYKKVLKQQISKNKLTLDSYKQELTNTYNQLVQFLKEIHTDTDKEDIKQYVVDTFVKARIKLAECFIKLETNIVIPDENFELIDPSVLIESNLNESYEQFLDEKVGTDSDEYLENVSDNNLNKTDKNSENKTEIMATTLIDFIKLCASTIPTFDGNPLLLNSFINAINLVEPLATTPALTETFINFIKTKLSGKALEALPDIANTKAIIENALKSKIKPESSKVIEGRLAALKADRNSLQNFSKIAEELSDNLKRSLIMEGMTVEKANEVAIDKTVKMCRASARTDLARAVIASTKFENTKEVISAFIVEIGQEAEEKQVLAYQATQYQRGNFKNRGRGSKNYQNNRSNQFNQNNYGNNGNNRGNNRGRGRGKRYNGNNNRNNGNYNGNYSQNGFNNSFRSDQNYDQNIRYVASGNGSHLVQNHRELENQQEM